jgi:hypothetical protein
LFFGLCSQESKYGAFTRVLESKTINAMWVWFRLPPELFKQCSVGRVLLRRLATRIILSTERSSVSAVCLVFI